MKTYAENRLACPCCCSARVLRMLTRSRWVCIDCGWSGLRREARAQFERLTAPDPILAESISQFASWHPPLRDLRFKDVRGNAYRYVPKTRFP